MLLAVTPFLRMGVKMHYSHLNGCNSRMLWNIQYTQVWSCFKENTQQIIEKHLKKMKV